MEQMDTINDSDNPQWNFQTVWNTNQVEAMPPECKAVLNAYGLCQLIHEITINMEIFFSRNRNWTITKTPWTVWHYLNFEEVSLEINFNRLYFKRKLYTQTLKRGHKVHLNMG